MSKGQDSEAINGMLASSAGNSSIPTTEVGFCLLVVLPPGSFDQRSDARNSSFSKLEMFPSMSGTKCLREL